MSIKHLYIHVPFCKTICSYCDFCHRVYEKDYVLKYLNSIKEEINNTLDNQYETIYLGGGTPTCLTSFELNELLSYLEPYTNNAKEFTIEVNPESLTLDKIELFKKYGINRISMGVESSDSNLLKLINRHHNFEDVKEKISLLKNNGIDNISIDLMYSLPTQTMKILKKTLNDFIYLDIPHVSIYSLTVEPNTVFSALNYSNLDDEVEADMYEYISKTLKNSGYIQYEVSNFSKDSYESKHNLSYWNYEDFIGIGPGASSKVGNHRWTNTKDINKYLNDYKSKDEDLILTLEDLAFENIMMSLRTIYGIDINAFNEKYNVDFKKKYQKALSNKNISIKDNNVICNNLELLNNILIDFMD